MATLPIRGTSLGNPDDAAARAIARGGKNPEHIRRYARSLWAACAELSVRADVAFAQADVETGDRSTGVGFRSDRWVQEGNPAGISIVTGMPDGTPGPVKTPEEWGIIHATHLGGYAGVDPPDAWKEMDIRWDAMIRAGYFGVAETVDDLDQRWAWDPRGSQDYGGKIEARWRLYDFPAMDTSTPPDPQPDPQEGNDMPKPYILIVAGHRSTSDPGNPTEKNLTDDLAREYTKAFRDAGYDADWWQRDLDKDHLPDQTSGSLSTVATGCRNVLRGKTDRMSVMLDLHFNGSRSPVHTIVPDNVGLKSGYGDGAPAGDTAANNTLDVRLASAISKAIVQDVSGMTLYNGMLGVPGVMSERETGVALDGRWRLGMFGATAIVQATAVRLVVEHGGTNDASKPDFFRKCAKAALRAVTEVFDVKVEPPKTDPKPDPEPIPGPNPLDYPLGMNKEVATILFGEVASNDNRVYTFDENGDISRAWIMNGRDTASFPRLVSVQNYGVGTSEHRQYFQFSDGTVLWRPNLTTAFRPLGQVEQVIDAVRDVVDDAKG